MIALKTVYLMGTDNLLSVRLNIIVCVGLSLIARMRHTADVTRVLDEHRCDG